MGSGKMEREMEKVKCWNKKHFIAQPQYIQNAITVCSV